MKIVSDNTIHGYRNVIVQDEHGNIGHGPTPEAAYDSARFSKLSILEAECGQDFGTISLDMLCNSSKQWE